ncbi:MAG TPA: HD-GYP domain-containing protein [Gaiellales bacterium]|jgi:HD-GYP domain-containing protein (c-di-GMP phosphodiesterase class II)
MLASLAALAPPLLVAAGARTVAGEFELPGVHVVAVTGTASFAAVISVLMTRAALHRNDMRAGLVGVAFTAVAGLMTVHGLATPGFLLEEYGRNATVGLAGVLAVPAGGLLLAAATLAPTVAAGARRIVMRLQMAVLAALLGFGVIGLTHPALIPLIPLQIEPWAYVVLFPVAAVYGWLAWRAVHTHQLTGRRADLVVAIGLAWLGASIVFYMLADVWSFQFWAAHALEAIGFAAVAGAVAVDLARQVPSHHLYRRIDGSDLLESEEDLLGGYVRSLTATMELRDPTTREHARRVAALAVRVGMHAGLPDPSLRTLAIAGLLHDIGKLQVPETILRKPGRLTDEEFAVIKTHPDRGADLLAHLGGFDRELPLVRHHHERFAGGGYPSGGPAERLPVEVRILTLCDVYDALTSMRAYREPWTHDRAMEQIVSESGTTFDPACVAALTEVLSGPDVRVTVLRRSLGRRHVIA